MKFEKMQGAVIIQAKSSSLLDLLIPTLVKTQPSGRSDATD
jgi:hypothetical protein